MAEGWVKLHRCFLSSSILRNGNMARFWVWCLLKASHSSVKARHGYIEAELSPGQFIFGREKAAEETGLTSDEVRTCVKALKAENSISVTTHFTRQFSILTLLNWGRYQNELRENPQPFAGEAPTYPQPVPTYKNDQELIILSTRARERVRACGDEEERELSEEESKRFESSFSPTKVCVLDVWRRERERYGLRYIRSPRNFRMADSVAAMIDDGIWTMEDWEIAVKNFMADPWAREHGGINALYEDFERWVSGGERSDGRTGKPNTSSNGHPGASRSRSGKYDTIDAANFG